MLASPTVWFTVLAATFAVQCLGWAWVGAGLRRVREAAPDDALGPLADGDRQPEREGVGPMAPAGEA